jgi:hypothetical protein
MLKLSTSLLPQVLTSFGRKDIVKIRDLKNVENIISRIAEGGLKSLQVISKAQG